MPSTRVLFCLLNASFFLVGCLRAPDNEVSGWQDNRTEVTRKCSGFTYALVLGSPTTLTGVVYEQQGMKRDDCGVVQSRFKFVEPKQYDLCREKGLFRPIDCFAFFDRKRKTFVAGSSKPLPSININELAKPPSGFTTMTAVFVKKEIQGAWEQMSKVENVWVRLQVRPIQAMENRIFGGIGGSTTLPGAFWVVDTVEWETLK